MQDEDEVTMVGEPVAIRLRPAAQQRAAAEPRSRDEADVAELEYLVRRCADLSRVAYVLTGDRTAADQVLERALHEVWRDWERIRAAEGTLAYVRRSVVAACLARVEDGPGRHRGGAAPDGLHRALLGLPGRQRACVVLAHVAGLRVAEIADVLQIGEAAVARHLERGMSVLRAFTPRTGGGAPSETTQEPM